MEGILGQPDALYNTHRYVYRQATHENITEECRFKCEQRVKNEHCLDSYRPRPGASISPEVRLFFQQVHTEVRQVT